MKVKEYFNCIPHIIKQKRYLRSLEANPTKDKGTLVSLTSIPSRFHSLHLVIASLLNQDVVPCPIHLWLDSESLSKLPKRIHELERLGLTIHECDDLRAYKKLVFAMEKFPDHNIITVDDDLLYPDYWLRHLLKGAADHPKSVSAYVCRNLSLKSSRELSPYKKSPRTKASASSPSHSHMAIGFAGVLYPAHVLHSDITNHKLFQEICPYNDDIWFKAMALLNDSKHHQIPVEFGDEIYLPFTQKISLKKVNVRSGANETQFKAVFDHYNLYGMLE